MSEKVTPIPEGYRTVTPHIVVRGAAEAIEFYKNAFGAVEDARMPGPDGKLMHAQITIGDSIVMLADEFPEWGAVGPLTVGGSSVTLHLYVEDCDAAFNRAVEAGATAKMAPNDAFWGDRYGQLVDPFGHVWSVATHVKDVTLDEMNAAAAAMGDCGGQ
jgi:PhnB protein